MKTAIYNKEGKEIKQFDLPKEIFDLPWNADLVANVVNAMLSNQRQPIAHTKDRSEVSGGGKKPWKQKGTGRARHGSRRSPIWVGGGITFGPRNEKDYSRKINKKEKAKALAVILSQKTRDNQIIFVDSLKIEEPKTATAKSILEALSKNESFKDLASKRKNSAYLALVEKDTNTKKSFQNFGNLEIETINDLNPVDMMKYKYLIIENPESSLPKLQTRLTVNKK